MIDHIVCPQCGSQIDFRDSGYIGAAKCDCCGRWYTIYADEITPEELITEEEKPAENIFIWL